MAGTFAWFLALRVLVAQDALFPEFPGWNLSKEIQEYEPSDLYNYIDGAADNYISHAFEELTVGEYKKGESGIKAEIYHHADIDNGFGIYASERFPDYSFIDIGTQAYISDDILNMYCGRYYIKLFAETGSMDENENLANLAKQIAEKFESREGMPAVLKLFPAINKNANTEQYINNGFLGYDFLGKAFTADYTDNGHNFKLFIIETADSTGTAKMLKDYMDFEGQAASVTGSGKILIQDKYNGKIYLFREGRYLTGTLDLDDENLCNTYLDKIKNNLDGK